MTTSPGRRGLPALLGATLALVFLLQPVFEVATAQAASSTVVRRGPNGATSVRHTHVRQPVARRTVVVAPVRPVPAVRPWYWGRVVAGVTIGTIIVASAVAVAPKPPSPELCWFWSDSTKTKGYWNYCTPPQS